MLNLTKQVMPNALKDRLFSIVRIPFYNLNSLLYNTAIMAPLIVINIGFSYGEPPSGNKRWHEVVVTDLISLQWRHNERDDVSNYKPSDYLLNRLFRRRP